MNSSNKQELTLDQHLAHRIINDVGGSGQPPVYGYQFFTAGLQPYLSTLEKEYLASYIKAGGSSFKLVVGYYGGGKTHFLYSVQDIAWNYNYITSYIEMSPESTPFHKLETVYRAIVANLMYRQTPREIFEGYDRGIEALIRSWYYTKFNEFSAVYKGEELDKAISAYVKTIESYESSSFQNAMRLAFYNLYKESDEDFDLIVQWLKGENPSKTELKKYKIYEQISKANAFKMIRCIIRWINEVGYSGLVILMDEAERRSGLTSKEKETQLLNLREVVDACSNQAINKTLILYAVPDDTFLEGKTGVYRALTDRLTSVFEGELNPTGVRIGLDQIEGDENSAITTLEEIGWKLAKIYEIAYNIQFDEGTVTGKINEEAVSAYNERYGETGFKRLFVRNVINTFHKLRASTPKM